MLLILTKVMPIVREGAIALGGDGKKSQIVEFVTGPLLIDSTGLAGIPYQDKKDPSKTYKNDNPARSILVNLGETPVMVVEYIERIQYMANQLQQSASNGNTHASSFWEIKKMIANDEGADEYGDYVLCIHKDQQAFSIIDLTQPIAGIIEDHAMIQRFFTHADAARVSEALTEAQTKILMDAILPPLALRKK